MLCAASPHAAAATAPEDGLQDADRPIYEQAFILADKAEYSAAMTTALQGRQTLLNKFFIWLDLIHQKDDKPQADEFTALDAFLTANRGWPRLDAIHLRAEERLPDDYSDEKVIVWFGQRDPLTVAGAMRLASALRTVGGSGAATDLVRRTWRSQSFTEQQEAVFLALFGNELRESDDVARLDRLLNQRAFTAADRQAKRLGRGYPRLAKAVSRLVRNRPGVDAAIAQVPPELQDDPGLLYERARWRQRRGYFDGVVELLDQATATVRWPERWWPLRQWAAREALDRGDTALAYRLASEHGLKSGVDFAEAEWISGWLALRFEQAPEQAYQHFVRLYDGVTTPISRARGAYWAAQAADRLGDTASAQTWYTRAAGHTTAFYGQQAIARLGRPLDLDLAASIQVSEADRSAFEALELVRLVRLLAAFDEQPYVTTFLTHLRGQADTASAHQLHAELSDSIGRPDQALFTAKQASGRGMAFVGNLFPVPPDIVRQLNANQSPEPALVLALIRQESAFDRRAVSRAGARGLMQLLPATARHVARTINVPYQRARLTEDAAYNLQLGRAYLSQLLEDFEGSTALALAAYNAGPQRVERWIKDFGDPRQPDVNPVDWIERIPFSETRNYVQRVLEGQVVYRLALNGQKTVLPLDQKGKELGQLP
jgi:peptidoglycan lytic transglycosylase